MSLTGGNFGIVAEKHLGRISIFNTATLNVIRQLTLGFDFIDVAITRDCNRAVATSDISRALVELNTRVSLPTVDVIRMGQFAMGDVDITPDGRFAVTGGEFGLALQVYSLQGDRFVSTLPAPFTIDPAISPAGNGLILSACCSTNAVRVLMINPNGTLIDTGREIPTGGATPINVTFTPDGNFAFVANFFGNSVGILDTRNPNNIRFLRTAGTNLNPNTIVVSPDATMLFVLTAFAVDVFRFSPVSGSLMPVMSFAHGLALDPAQFFGSDLMALDPARRRLFISANVSRELKVFTTTGQLVGFVPGVEANGGVAVCQ